MRFDELLTFRNDLYFEGAVQADWFYKSELAEKVATSFVFHGPNTHAVTVEEVGYNNLIDTASFVQLLADKLSGRKSKINPFTLAIAGYGTGKSHLSVALAELLSGKSHNENAFAGIIENLKRADETIGNSIERDLTETNNLVLTINGVNDFDLHYELLRTAQKALVTYGVSDDVIRSLDQAHETARVFVQKTFELLQDAFEECAQEYDIYYNGEELKKYLVDNIVQNERCFNCVNKVYYNMNGHEIRWDEGVSAKQILQALLDSCCGKNGRFNHIVILFDELGRFLEYTSANPGKSGSSALQQIFEAVQNAKSQIQFVGFIQADIKAYLQRVEKATNISRYIDRFDASEKVYLSSNLETIFANLIEITDKEAFQQSVGEYFNINKEQNSKMHANIKRWLPVKGIWDKFVDFERVIMSDLYPLHPISTFLLTALTDWLQNRSSLTLLNEKFKSLADYEISKAEDVPILYPVDLLQGNFFMELLNAEEQGRQRSQICIMYNALYSKYHQKLTEDELNILLANVILRICRFKTESRKDTIDALAMCANLTELRAIAALDILENEYAIISYDDRACQFDFIVDAVGAGEFRSYIRKKKAEVQFSPSILASNEVVNKAAAIDTPFETRFGDELGIQTFEWEFAQTLIAAEDLTEKVFQTIVGKWKNTITTNKPKGTLLWVYVGKDTQSEKIEEIRHYVNTYCKDYPIALLVLNDVEDKLKDAVIDYLTYTYVDETSKKRYERFFDEGLQNAIANVENQFDDLKRERLEITDSGFQRTERRMVVYLTEIFKRIYPHAVPFDFEEFKKPTLTKAKKIYGILVKSLISESISQNIKVQSGDVKSRFDSVLRLGMYSWNTVNQDFQLVIPKNESVNTIYQMLKDRFELKNQLDLNDVLDELCAPPYGMNEHSALLLLIIFSINVGNYSRLEANKERYNYNRWIESVVVESKVDEKLIRATVLKKVDTEAATRKFKSLFNQIEYENECGILLRLEKELEALSKNNELPDTLSAEYKLSHMRLKAANKGYNYYDAFAGKIRTAYAEARAEGENGIVKYLDLILDVNNFSPICSFDGVEIKLEDEIVAEIKTTGKKAEEFVIAHINNWIPKQKCQEISMLNRYLEKMKHVIGVLQKLGYEKEAKQVFAIAKREKNSVDLIKNRQKFRANCNVFLDNTKKVGEKTVLRILEEWKVQGEELIELYSSFNPNDLNDTYIQQHKMLKKRIGEIETQIQNRKQEMDDLFNEVYDVTSLADIKRVSIRITALLSAGVPAREQKDFENIQAYIDQFRRDVDRLEHHLGDRNALKEYYQLLCEKYCAEDVEVDLSTVLDNCYSDYIQRADKQEQVWIKRNLNVDFSQKTEEQLDAWKRSAADLPKYLSEATIQQVEDMLKTIENLLSQKRVKYIATLYKRLSEAEKQQLAEMLGLKRN